MRTRHMENQNLCMKEQRTKNKEHESNRQWTCEKIFLSKDDILRRRLLVLMFAEGVPQAPVFFFFFVCCKSCYILVSIV